MRIKINCLKFLFCLIACQLSVIGHTGSVIPGNDNIDVPVLPVKPKLVYSSQHGAKNNSINFIEGEIFQKDKRAGAVEVANPAARMYEEGRTSTLVENAFYFPELDNEVESYLLGEETAPLVAPPPSGSFGSFMNTVAKGQYADKAKRAKAIIEEALDIGKRIDGLTGGNLVAMPLVLEQQIGQKLVSIIFNKAKIYPQYAEIEVYIKIDMAQQDFQGNPVVLYFGAEDIKFSSEDGIISGVVGLLSDYAIKLGDSSDAGLFLKAFSLDNDNGDLDPSNDVYSGTYVSFDCDGFREIGIAGNVILSRKWVMPTDEWGVPVGGVPDTTTDIGSVPRVQGAFQLIAQDLDDIMVSIDINSPFVLTEWQEMVFELSNANLDMSTYRNPAGVPQTFVSASNVAWEGVYIEHVGITLPEPFKRSCTSFAQTQAVNDTTANTSYAPPQTCRIKVSANDLLIDGGGVSGDFSLEGQAPLIGGAVMDGEWGWSLDQIGISLLDSKVTAFDFSGQIATPILSKQTPLSYEAETVFSPGSHFYSFTVSADSLAYEIPVWNAAEVQLVGPSVNITIDGGEFAAGVSFSQVGVSIGNHNDYAQSNTGSLVKMPGLTVYGLTLSTRNPRISASGVEVNGGDSKLINFPIGINSISLGTSPSNQDELILGFAITLNLMDSDDSAITATGGFQLYGEYTRDIDGTRSWRYKNLKFNSALVEVDLPKFYALGVLHIMRDDSIYGNGFHAAMDASILDGKFELSMAAIFGSTNSYRYWMVDGFLGSGSFGEEGTPGIPIFPPFYLDGFGGGAFYHMRPHAYVGAGSLAVANGPGVDLSGIQYHPSSQTKFGIKFATSLTTEGRLMDGLLTCLIQFNDSLGLDNITFWGTAELMNQSALDEKKEFTEDELRGRVETITQPQAQTQQEDANLVNTSAGLMAKLGISLSFDEGFVMHMYGDVNIHVGDILTGSGNLDVLLDGNTGKWHLYLGGYYDGSVVVPSFFGDTPMQLLPVNATLNYDNFSVTANMYFLTGNDIPGPPPPPEQVVTFFGAAASEGNRSLLNDCANPAMGTGIAFGASAFFNFQKVKKGLFGSCVLGLKVNVNGGFGFDLALLKYGSGAVCGAGGSGEGINGFRATGRAFAFAAIESGHLTCIPIPPLGIGLAVKFDVPDPSYFDVLAVIKVGQTFMFHLELGEECGTPCSAGVNLSDVN